MTALDLLVQITVKGTLVLAVAGLATRLMGRSSAAARHWVWTVALIAALAAPVVGLVVPGWRLPVLPAELGVQPDSPPPGRVNQPTGLTLITPLGARAREIGLDAVATARTRAPGARGASAVGGFGAPASTPTETAARDSSGRRPAAWWDIASRWFTWPMMALGLWLVGMAIGLGRLAAGLLHAHRMARESTPVTALDWLAALDEGREALGLSSAVALRQSDRVSIPIACGIGTPSVVLPSQAGSWSADRRRVVLLHELAHVRRHDCLTQVIARAAAAVHWFNPLAHVASARLNAEQEQAADDLVLAAGTTGADYADHLVDIVRAFREAGRMNRLPGTVWAALAMTRKARIERRLVAILDEARNRQEPSGRTLAIATTLILAAALSLGAVQFVSADAADEQDGTARVYAAPAAAAVPGPRIVVPAQPVTAAQPAQGGTAAAPAEPAPPRPDVDRRPVRPAGTPAPAVPDSPAARLWDFATPWEPADRNAFEYFLHLDPGAEFHWEGGNGVHVAGGGAYLDEQFVGPGLWAAPRPFAGAGGQSAESSDDDPARAAARQRAAEALSAALDDESERVRRTAAQALATMRDERAVPVLIQAMQSSDENVRRTIVASLATFDAPEAKAAVRAALQDADAGVRRQAALAVTRDRDPANIDALARLLQDPETNIRLLAIQALGAIDDPQVVAPLTTALEDSEERVRDRAAQALGRIASGGRNISLTYWTALDFNGNSGGPVVVGTKGDLILSQRLRGLEAQRESITATRERLQQQLEALRSRLQDAAPAGEARQEQLRRQLRDLEAMLERLRAQSEALEVERQDRLRAQEPEQAEQERIRQRDRAEQERIQAQQAAEQERAQEAQQPER